MRWPIVALVAVLFPLLIAVACGGGGRPETTGSPSASETPQATASETPQPTAAETPQPTLVETPQAGVTPSTPDGEVQAAVVAPDQGGFLAQFADAMIIGKTCDYDSDSGLVDCGADGLYQLQDGIQGSKAVCRVVLVDDLPVGLSCQAEDPLRSIFYTID